VGFISAIQPKKPQSDKWEVIPVDTSRFTHGYVGVTYGSSDGFFVISAVEVMDGEPFYHISLSKESRQRCTRNEVRAVIRDFGMCGAEEDTSGAALARHFFLAVADRDEVDGYEQD